MATKAFQPSYRLGLFSTPMVRARAAAAEAWEKGAVLVRAVSPDNGYIAEAGANPARILGIAAHEIPTSGTGTQANSNTFAAFVPALPHVAFEGTVLGGSATQIALTETMLFGSYGITADSTTSWYIDTSKSGVNARVRIIELIDDTGVIDGRVVFVFTSSSWHQADAWA